MPITCSTAVNIRMATASWLDPTTRQARLMKKHDLQAIPQMVHKLEVCCYDKNIFCLFWLKEPRETPPEELRMWVSSDAGVVSG